MKIKNLPSGSYTWSVQSIDNCYEGSAFAAEHSFSHVNTGVEDIEKPVASGLVLFPNPVSDRITITTVGPDVSKCEIIISDMTGRQHKRIRGIELPFDLSTESLKPGVYIITLIVDGTIAEAKFLKI